MALLRYIFQGCCNRYIASINGQIFFKLQIPVRCYILFIVMFWYIVCTRGATILHFLQFLQFLVLSQELMQEFPSNISYNLAVRR